ncbi:MAG: hypothetical protein KKB20_06730 [Proteobacteria bacterium]|nr:hypothetical protein [Pseudomonadota bacterium]
MSVKDKAERAQNAVFQALLPVLKDLWPDREAFRQVGPALVSSAVYIMINDLGPQLTAALLHDMAERVERGDFTSPFPDSSDPFH